MDGDVIPSSSLPKGVGGVRRERGEIQGNPVFGGSMAELSPKAYFEI